jgi:hypothetical protein
VLVVLVVLIVAAVWAGSVVVIFALCAASGRADELTRPACVGRRGVRGLRDRRREARPGSPERRSRHRAWIDVTG